jgi:hypothetical protein
MEEQFFKVTNTKVDVANSTTTVLAANNDRSFARFSNDSDEAIYLCLGGDAVMNEGIRLAPGTTAYDNTFEINKNNLFKGVINAICSSGSKNLCVVEGEDKYQ